MAVKALVWIESVAPETDNTFQLNLRIWSGVNLAQVPNDSWFAPGASALSINGAIRAFAESYIQTTWSVDFNPLLDSVRLINPLTSV